MINVIKTNSSWSSGNTNNLLSPGNYSRLQLSRLFRSINWTR